MKGIVVRAVFLLGMVVAIVLQLRFLREIQDENAAMRVKIIARAIETAKLVNCNLVTFNNKGGVEFSYDESFAADTVIVRGKP